MHMYELNTSELLRCWQLHEPGGDFQHCQRPRGVAHVRVLIL